MNSSFKRLLILIIFVLILLFFWFQIRPSLIRSECSQLAIDKAIKLTQTQAGSYPNDYQLQQSASKGMYQKSSYNSYYQMCLNSKGL